MSLRDRLYENVTFKVLYHFFHFFYPISSLSYLIAFLFLGRRMRHSDRGKSPMEAIETGPGVNQLDCHRSKIINNKSEFFFVFGPCLSAISSFAIISLRGRESWLLYIHCLLVAMWL